MQPTPRGSGVWESAQKDTRARRYAANIRNTAGRAILLPPERKLRRTAHDNHPLSDCAKLTNAAVILNESNHAQ